MFLVAGNSGLDPCPNFPFELFAGGIVSPPLRSQMRGYPEPIVASQHLQAHDRLFILALSPADGYQFQLSSPCSQPFHEQRVNDN
jgi:hypothetical protein